MISTEIRMNGILIGHIYCTNKGPVGNCDERDDRRLYEYEYYRPELQKNIKGAVIHKRSEGAERLLQLILGSVMGTLQLEPKRN